jgi:hypothetical protein
MYEPKNCKISDIKEKSSNKKNNKINDDNKMEDKNIINIEENKNNDLNKINIKIEDEKKNINQNNNIPLNTIDKNKTNEKYLEEINLKKNILDPLSVIIKLAILSKKQNGTKISVYNNILYIQEVGMFQSFVRIIFKNNKVDIQYLYNPIEYACKYFLNKDYIKINPNIKKIFINAQNGLKSLMETYKEHIIITHTLYFYYNIIQNYLSENYNEKLFMNDSFTIFYKEELLKELNSQWTNEKIKIVLEMIEFINSEKESNKSVKCLEEFMVIIDNNITKINF